MNARHPVRGGLLIAAALVVLFGGAIVLAAGGHSSSRDAEAVRGSGIRMLSITCRSPSLGGRLPARVYLPPGYGRKVRRHYPVVYFLHGLPGNPQSYTQNPFVSDALAADRERAIVVAPQGARASESDREYLDWSETENWPRAISVDLVRCVDRRWRAIANRTGRVLVGLSAGGYGAFNVGLRSLRTFGAVESWSGYFVATDPSGYHVLKLGSRAAQAEATVPSGAGLARAVARWPTLIAFYVGNTDDRFADVNQTFDAALRQHGVGHVFRVYPGGHSAMLWRSDAPGWLAMALRYLSTGRIALPRG